MSGETKIFGDFCGIGWAIVSTKVGQLGYTTNILETVMNAHEIASDKTKTVKSTKPKIKKNK